jgi:hypothetical protein
MQEAGAQYLYLAEFTLLPTRGHHLSAYLAVLYSFLCESLLNLCSSCCLAPEIVDDDGDNLIRVE